MNSLKSMQVLLMRSESSTENAKTGTAFFRFNINAPKSHFCCTNCELDLSRSSNLGLSGNSPGWQSTRAAHGAKAVGRPSLSNFSSKPLNQSNSFHPTFF
jgi:hypothetical protein